VLSPLFSVYKTEYIKTIRQYWLDDGKLSFQQNTCTCNEHSRIFSTPTLKLYSNLCRYPLVCLKKRFSIHTNVARLYGWICTHLLSHHQLEHLLYYRTNLFLLPNLKSLECQHVATVRHATKPDRVSLIEAPCRNIVFGK
jgi:hypothetical protein